MTPRTYPTYGLTPATHVGWALLIVLVGAFVGLNVRWWERREAVVRPGVLYRSGQLHAAELRRFVDRHGIRTIVNLRTREHPDERQVVAERAGTLRYVRLPSGQVPPMANVERFRELMADPANHPVLVHCNHGMGRAGLYTAVYRMDFEGWPLERALEEARQHAGYGTFREGQGKTRFLRAHWPAAHPASGGSATPR